MSQSLIEQAIAVGTEWMEANKNHPDVAAFARVASAMADLARVAYPGKKETAGDAAVVYSDIHVKIVQSLNQKSELLLGIFGTKTGGSEMAQEIFELISSKKIQVTGGAIITIFEMVLLIFLSSRSTQELQSLQTSLGKAVLVPGFRCGIYGSAD